MIKTCEIEQILNLFQDNFKYKMWKHTLNKSKMMCLKMQCKMTIDEVSWFLNLE